MTKRGRCEGWGSREIGGEQGGRACGASRRDHAAACCSAMGMMGMIVMASEVMARMRRGLMRGR
jgi:hypothetical protein